MATLVLTFILFIFFSVVLVYSDIENIKANWNVRRCELPIMFTGSFYKPSTYPKSGSEFASENFQYCGRKIAQDVIRVGMAPYYAVASQQSDAQKSMAGPMNNMRGMLATTKQQFSEFLNLQYKKYENIIFGITKTFLHFKFALGRIQAMIYAMLYLMLSLFTAIMNTMKLTIFAVKVFLGILMALMILLFPVLSPFMVIITAATAIVAAFGLSVADAADDAICCDPDAKVYMEDGTIKYLRDIQIGDILKSSKHQDTKNRVEGILVADGTKTTIYEIDGVRMSASHSIFYNSKWILAKDHPNAKHTSDIIETLICLNTSHHEVHLVGKTTKAVIVSDWEEVSTLQGQKAWIDWVHLVLNGYYIDVKKYPTTIPLVSPNTRIFSEVRGSIPIESVELGEKIKYKDGYTAVKALYRGQIKTDIEGELPEWISDGVWSLQNKTFWSTHSNGIHAVKKSTKHFIDGYFLITEDEMFCLEHNGAILDVRDFTEVGLKNIDQSYEMIQFFMNKK